MTIKRTASLRVSLFLIISIAVLLLAVWTKPASSTPFISQDLGISQNPDISTGTQYLKNGEYDKAIDQALESVEKDRLDWQARLLLVLAHLGKGEEAQAWAIAEGTPSGIAPDNRAMIYKSIAQYYLAKKRYYRALKAFEKGLGINESADLLRGSGAVYLDRGQIEKARSYYERLTVYQAGYLELSRIYLKEKKYDLSIKNAREAIQQDVESTGAQIVLGTSYLMSYRLDEAREVFLRLKKENPELILAGHMLGLIYLCQGENELAIQASDDVLKLAPRLKEAHQKKAIALHLSGKLDEALISAQKAIDSEPNDAFSNLVLAGIYLSQKQNESAAQQLKKAGGLFLDFTNPAFHPSAYFSAADTMSPAYFSLANLYYREGLYEKSCEAIELAQKDESTQNPFYILTQARAKAKTGSVTAAKKLYSEVVDNNPEMIASYLEMGDLEYENENYAGAVSYYQKALNINPTLPRAYFGLGEFYYRSDEIDEAVSAYKKLAEIIPKSATAYNQLAWIIADKKQDYNQALEYGEKAYDLASEDEQVVDTMGWIYYKLGKNEKALQFYEGMAAEATSPGFYYHLGLVRNKLNQKDKAIEAIENALNISDEFSEAGEAMKLLNSLSGY